jgi:tripartite-type tricarboxylate transporter receptor subunit TctC
MAEAFAKEIKQKYPNKDIAMVHFSNSNEAFLSVMGGHTDASFEFLGDARAKATPETTLVGLTGYKKVEGITPLKDQGFNDMADLQGIFAFYVPKDTLQATIDELQKIFLEAEKAESVQRLYKTDYATKDAYMSKPGDLSKWYANTTKRFEYYTKGIEVK